MIRPSLALGAVVALALAPHPQQAARRLDMSAHKAHYTQITAFSVPAPSVSRIYAVLENRAE